MQESHTISIGKLLRRFRLGSGLSQESLSERSGVSVRTISDLERGQRKTARVATLRLLADSLKLSSSDRVKLLMIASGGCDRPAEQSIDVGVGFEPGRLPIPPNRTIGRRRETASVAEHVILGKDRIVTLTGPGGVGKTRVAITAAEASARYFDLGVHFVPLATISDARNLPAAIATSFGLPAGQQKTVPDRIHTLLEGQTLLMVLDNFEQILAAAPFVHELADACDSMTILVTSRSPLRLTNEREFPILPLALPKEGDIDEQLENLPAVRLFRDRAYWTEEDEYRTDITSIAAIVSRLDGLPLAIELAAAWTRALTPSALLERLEQRLPMLDRGPRDAPKRLQSMSDAIAWSYELLTPEQQQTFCYVSVFEGGFTLGAAEAVCPSPKDVTLDAVQSLVEHGLVRRSINDAGSPKFTTLETIRELGLILLEERGEIDACRDLHLEWATSQTMEPSGEDWFLRRRSEIPTVHDPDNVRAALQWAIDAGDLTSAARLAFGLRIFWQVQGRFQEAERYLGFITSRVRQPYSLIDAGVHFAKAVYSYHLGHLQVARSDMARADRICRDLGFDRGEEICLLYRGMATRWTDPKETIRMLTELIEFQNREVEKRFRADCIHQRAFTRMMIGDAVGAMKDVDRAMPFLASLPRSDSYVSYASANFGWTFALAGDLVTAEQLAIQCLEVGRELQVSEYESFAHMLLGEIAMQQEQLPEALEHFQSALRIHYRALLELWLGFAIGHVARVAQAVGETIQAANLFGAADAIWTRLEFAESLKKSGPWFIRCKPGPELLEDERFVEQFERGKSLSAREVYDTAMSVSVPTSASPLSRRETEVLNHVAAGLTNQEIADELYLSRRTIDSHISSSLHKLGVSTRRQAVRTAQNLGLIESP